jgi:DMSO/TMAO reductase YedYZ molybdopterin-dependent catalytic subunit
MPPFMKQKDPSIPPGQVETKKFPVLHVGDVPAIDTATYRLAFTGLIAHPFELSYDELRALPATAYNGDIHCVTRWSKKAMPWRGTSFRALAAMAQPLPSVTHVIQYADNDYTTSVPLAQMLDDDVLIAWEYEGRPLEPIHGGPVRVLVPKLYFWKSSKWIHRIDFQDHDELGFWEKRGYSNEADPWKEQRYAGLPLWMDRTTGTAKPRP